MKEQGITDITERRAAIARAAEDAKAAEAAKQVEIEAAAQQSQPMVAAAGGSPAGGGTIQVGSVRSTASGRRGGGRSFTAVPPPPPLKPSPTKPAPAEVAPEYPLPESATPEFSAVTPRPSARKATPGWFTRRMQELLIKLRLGVPPEVLPDMQIGYAGRESSALVEGAAGRASRVAPTPSPETPVATTAEQAAPTPSATSTQQAAPTASAESFEQGALATSMLPSRVAAALPTARSEAAQPSEAVQRVALVDRMQSIVLSIAETDSFVKGETQLPQRIIQPRSFVHTCGKDHDCALVEDDEQFETCLLDRLKQRRVMGQPSRKNHAADVEWNTKPPKTLDERVRRTFAE